MQIRLGYDTYSIRAFGWKAMQHLEYAAQQQLDAIQFSSLDDYESLDAEHLAKVKRRAQELDIQIDAGIGCACPLSQSWNPKHGTPQQVLERGLEVAQAVGATSMRCYMGSGKDRYNDNVPLEKVMQSLIDTFKSVRSKALHLGVKIAIENHKDLQAWQIKTVIEESGKDFVGSCMDLGNPTYVMENPLTTIETLGPYVVTTHVRDTAVYEEPRGAAVQWTALGEGSVDLATFFEKFKQVCPQSAVQLEIITGRPPEILRYLEPSFWKYYQGMPARDFARFVALAKSGRPFSGRMVIEDYEGQKPLPQYQEALKFQQKDDLERSFRYAKEKLGLGLKKG